MYILPVMVVGVVETLHFYAAPEDLKEICFA
jgi:hypothetical protein